MFYECASLVSVTIPNGVTAIGDGAFLFCTSLKSMTIPASVKKISDDAFMGCDNFTIRCKSGSYAHNFARDKGYNFILV
jgi:hypothetical protein